MPCAALKDSQTTVRRKRDNLALDCESRGILQFLRFEVSKKLEGAGSK